MRVSVEWSMRVSLVVTPPAVAVRVSVSDWVMVSDPRNACESVLASDVLSEDPPGADQPERAQRR